MLVDLTAAARRADPDQLRAWLAEQRVFISSAMSDTAEARRAVAAIIESLGARAVWFEEFGRDADAAEAYLTEVDAATIYVAILNEHYGRLNPPGYSATEAEYRRAREGGKRIALFLAGVAPRREGDLARFIERVRYYITTENYSDEADLSRRMERRLNELAGEALSPWVKLGDLVFRADEIDDRGEAITVTARVSEEVAHRLETLRGDRFTRSRVRFVHRSRVRDGELMSIRRTTRATGADEVAVELGAVRFPEIDRMRSGANGVSADDLIEYGLRALLFAEPLPERLGMLEFMAETGIVRDDLHHAFELPNEFAESITRLVIADGLVGSGRAGRILSLTVGTLVGETRRIALEWEEAKVYTNVEPGRRSLEGDWRRA
jgi:hypothetical protein